MAQILAILLAVILLAAGHGSEAHAQKSTELYIPVGHSPGISHILSVIGKIETLNEQTRTISIVFSSGSWTAEVTEDTTIWVDRSKVTLPNKAGRLADLRVGRLVEIKYADNAQRGRGAAEWIKVQLPKATREP